MILYRNILHVLRSIQHFAVKKRKIDLIIKKLAEIDLAPATCLFLYLQHEESVLSLFFQVSPTRMNVLLDALLPGSL